jgi:hypothetical protein
MFMEKLSWFICPKRKDNRLVTGKRIADKYERIINVNPSWTLRSIKAIVLKNMGADLTLCKVQREKVIVMRKIYESAKGESSRMVENQIVCSDHLGGGGGGPTLTTNPF